MTNYKPQSDSAVMGEITPNAEMKTSDNGSLLKKRDAANSHTTAV